MLLLLGLTYTTTEVLLNVFEVNNSPANDVFSDELFRYLYNWSFFNVFYSLQKTQREDGRLVLIIQSIVWISYITTQFKC